MSPRILIAAENASVRFGGEAILPYHYFRLLRARGLDAHLIVHDRCRAELETLFPDDLTRLHFVADQPLQKLFFRLGRALPRRVDEATLGFANQMLTQAAQRSLLSDLIAQAPGAAVVHQPIPVSPRTPSLLSGLGAPLVCGPLNGGMEYPPAFRAREFWLSRLTLELARQLSEVFNALLPGKRDAAAVLVANTRTRAALPANIRGRVIELPENGVDTAQWTPSEDASAEVRGNFLFIGRLVDWKALEIVLEAVARTSGITLDIIGDGPMRDAWQTLAAEVLGIGDRVRFHGWKTQGECAAALRECGALVLPSLFECGGAVVLEAMAMSRPVIATAWGGPQDYLTDSCGILLPPTGREDLIAGFASAMRSLAENPARAAELGAAGRQRLLQHFDWDRKIDTMLTIYDSVLPSRRA